MSCNSCVHKTVCDLWRRQECQDASCFCAADCDYYEIKDKPPLKVAIKKLRRKYEEAKTDDSIRDPLAYALYHTWREISEAHNKKENMK